jgi:hypothetical protein
MNWWLRGRSGQLSKYSVVVPEPSPMIIRQGFFRCSAQEAGQCYEHFHYDSLMRLRRSCSGSRAAVTGFALSSASHNRLEHGKDFVLEPETRTGDRISLRDVAQVIVI